MLMQSSAICAHVEHINHFITAHDTEHLPLQSAGRLVVSSCEYNMPAFHTDLFQALEITQPDVLAGAIDKRLAEFLAGRFCAAAALRALEIKSTYVASNAQRAPVWPVGSLGSISHTNSQAVCIAGLGENLDYIGADIENWMSEKTASNLTSMIITPQEARRLHRNDESLVRLLTVVFSAKESLYKAVYPYVGRIFGFEAAEVVEISTQHQFVDLRIKEDLSARIYAGLLFRCHFESRRHSVFTFMAGCLREKAVDLIKKVN
ncbi:4'-phosphopantetheinyl transferase superfamily protein [Pseudoalteromonas sp. J010]|uniref:4'-phosphopantetheinyl transferase family protein n=1 Tax=Pseudoalteromonas sp. J010 TaxID=998465 RepID=UPI000F64F786|nr:4'-phosphopantetheinyl transferase superfamily protein [Pseudoalteromonas sp. J010]RRS06764.1 4'-phosphopantetheinyl transferase superfamily protein [Pseudoalteromonas sp. J010]